MNVLFSIVLLKINLLTYLLLYNKNMLLSLMNDREIGHLVNLTFKYK